MDHAISPVSNVLLDTASDIIYCHNDSPQNKLNSDFLGLSKVVTGICSRPWSRCILAEFNLARNKYEGYLANNFPYEK